MPKYGERHKPSVPPPDYAAIAWKRLEDNPPIVEAAVLCESVFGLWVRCVCGNHFEYLRDQVNCRRCGRIFNPSDAEDLVGSVSYGEWT